MRLHQRHKFANQVLRKSASVLKRCVKRSDSDDATLTVSWFSQVRVALLCAALIGFAATVESFGAEAQGGKGATPPGTFLNPLGDPPIHLEDPFILALSKKYYLFGAIPTLDAIQCYESTNLVNWKLDGWAWHKTALSVARGDLRAPQVFQYQGMFCMVYSAYTPQGTRLALAASTKPEGPYHDLHAPWLSLGDACTSGDVFIDRNGKAYLIYCKRSSQNGCVCSSVFGVALTKDLSKTTGEPVNLMDAAQGWELARREVFRSNEAARIFRIGPKYFLTYTANDPASADCAVGYATAEKPLGPWTKSLENPILSSRASIGAVAPGHASVFRSLDLSNYFIVYNTLADPANPSAGGLVNLDHLILAAGPRLSVQGPSRSPQPLSYGTR